MQRNKQNKFIVNAGLLGVGAVLGFSVVSNAAPNDVKRERRDVKEARKDVKDARKDVRKADTPWERRDAQQDLREAQRDVQREKRDVRQERRENNRPGYPNNGNWNRPSSYPNNGNWNRPGYGSNGGTWSTQNYTIEGTVISNNAGRNFTLRATTGQVWQVQVQGSTPVGFSRGDVVRVFGPTRGTSILASGLRILQNR